MAVDVFFKKARIPMGTDKNKSKGSNRKWARAITWDEAFDVYGYDKDFEKEEQND
jgi:hypothetical protein